MSVLEIKDLKITYGKTLAVESISIKVESETAVLFGPSGCGKTSILKAILGVNEPGMKIDGQILFEGKPLLMGKGDIGMVFQGPVVPRWMRLYDLCRMGCNIRNLRISEQHKKIFTMLERFRIGHLSDCFPSQMSGGEKQRAALAVTLINDPKLLLLDEPTTFIDGVNRLIIWNFVENVMRPLKIPIIIVCHDPAEAITLGDRIFVLGKPAKLVRTVSVPFDHPRSDEISRNSAFWAKKREISL